MGSLTFAIGVAVLVFVAGILGLTLRGRLPDKHSLDKSADMIGAMTGLLSAQPAWETIEALGAVPIDTRGS